MENQENLNETTITINPVLTRIKLVNRNGKTSIHCNDPKINNGVICQSTSAFSAFCNSLVTLLGCKIEPDEEGGER